MDKIKHFFDQKKAKMKFAIMGEGSKLTQSQTLKPSPSQPTNDCHSSQSRAEQTDDARRAGEAALARLRNTNHPRVPVASSTYMRLKSQIEEEVKRDLLQTSAPQQLPGQREIVKDGPKVLEVSGIYFSCPLIGNETAPWQEMKDKISKFLEEQLLTQEPTMAAALMIHSLNNKDPERPQKCIEILSKYLENIIANPSDEKFCRIRVANKALQEKIIPVRGGNEFLQAVGFDCKTFDGDNGPEQYLYMPPDRRCPDVLKDKLETLILAEPIIPVLERGIRVFFPSANAGRFGDLPDEFYAISKEELRREMQARQDEVEKLGMLRTKEMRERDAKRELRRYRFALLRFRFPDQTILQGTFWSTETSKNLIEFVKEHVEPEWAPFTLSCRTSQGNTLSLAEETQGSIAEHGLCPSSLINVCFDADLIAQCNKEHVPPPRLKSSTLELIQPL